MQTSLQNIRQLTKQLAADNARLQKQFLHSLPHMVDGIVTAAQEDRWDAVKRQTSTLEAAAKAADCDELVAAAEALVTQAESDDPIQQARALMKLIGVSGREKLK